MRRFGNQDPYLVDSADIAYRQREAEAAAREAFRTGIDEIQKVFNQIFPEGQEEGETKSLEERLRRASANISTILGPFADGGIHLARAVGYEQTLAQNGLTAQQNETSP